MDPKSLREFLDALVKSPDLQPRDGLTFCNIGAKRTLEYFGGKDFYVPNIVADTMYSLLSSNLSGKWSRIDPEFASEQANEGKLVFAALPSWVLTGGHGHIAPLFPAPMEYSESLKMKVCMISNVGKVNAVMRTSQAFPPRWGNPQFYLYVPGAIAPYAG